MSEEKELTVEEISKKRIAYHIEYVRQMHEAAADYNKSMVDDAVAFIKKKLHM